MAIAQADKSKKEIKTKRSGAVHKLLYSFCVQVETCMIHITAYVIIVIQPFTLFSCSFTRINRTVWHEAKIISFSGISKYIKKERQQEKEN